MRPGKEVALLLSLAAHFPLPDLYAPVLGATLPESERSSAVPGNVILNRLLYLLEPQFL